MIRERSHMFVKDLAGWNLTLEAIAAANQVAEQRGWPTTQVFTLVSGPFNEIVGEVEYPDLNSYLSVGEAFLADAEVMAIMKPAMEAMVVERSWNELLMAAEPVG